MNRCLAVGLMLLLAVVAPSAQLSRAITTPTTTPALANPACPSLVRIEATTNPDANTFHNWRRVTQDLTPQDPVVKGERIEGHITFQWYGQLSDTGEECHLMLSVDLQVTEKQGPNSVMDMAGPCCDPWGITAQLLSASCLAEVDGGGGASGTTLCEAGGIDTPGYVAQATTGTAVSAAGGGQCCGVTGGLPGVARVEAVYKLIRPSTDLGLTITDSPDPATEGNDLTYSLAIKNNGPIDATGVQVEDTLPPGVIFVPELSSQGCLGTTLVRCAVATLANQTTVTLTIVVKPTAAVIGTTILNKASVMADQYDPDLNSPLSLNTFTTETFIGGCPLEDLTRPKFTNRISKRLEQGEVIWEHTTPRLRLAKARFHFLATLKGWTVKYTAAYRTEEYQEHLLDIVTKLNDARMNLPDCQELKKRYNDEKKKHGLGTVVSRKNWPHPKGIAFDAVVRNKQGERLNENGQHTPALDELAERAGLYRPPHLIEKDAVHFQLKQD